MSLLETTVAAVIVSGAASCSLHLWGLGTTWSQRMDQQRLGSTRLESELVASLARLHNAAGQMDPALPCPEAAERALALLTQTPVTEEGVQRTVQQRGVALLLQLSSTEPPLKRQRLLHPIALGLCRSQPRQALPAPPPDPPLDPPVDVDPATTDPAVTDPTPTDPASTDPATSNPSAPDAAAKDPGSAGSGTDLSATSSTDLARGTVALSQTTAGGNDGTP
ncbi:hypothetical protein [Synechococcus sp. CCY9202]|uniref:hypothetical protein n=1 Tax=Synechococcus sp. CCY9202 TaxID=174698 RepID=UPI002B1EB943|nr:hypothetical protein [Synechococcus sp. CCY9202]MEA5423157.1 hypothetical protein [Synechococcus sp. CCY9202]